jgi:hypothetical protein
LKLQSKEIEMTTCPGQGQGIVLPKQMVFTVEEIEGFEAKSKSTYTVWDSDGIFFAMWQHEVPFDAGVEVFRKLKDNNEGSSWSHKKRIGLFKTQMRRFTLYWA